MPTLDQGTNFRGLKIQDKKLVSDTRIERQGVRRAVAEDPAVELVSPDGISHGGVVREVLLSGGCWQRMCLAAGPVTVVGVLEEVPAGDVSVEASTG